MLYEEIRICRFYGFCYLRVIVFARLPDKLHVRVFLDGCQTGCQRVVDGACTQAATYNQDCLFAGL